jgi:thiol-disulfide isomerase/thioredoxin
MRTAFVVLLLSTSLSAMSQDIYINRKGMTYSQSQFESLVQAGTTIRKLKDTVVNQMTYTLIELTRNSEYVNPYGEFVDQPMVPFRFADLDGTVYQLSDLKGKVVMLNFWAISCGPCRVEMPELNRLKKTYEDQVVFLAPAPDSSEAIHEMLKSHPFTFNILAETQILFRQLGINGYPVNFFVDKSGVIREIRTGTPMMRDMETGKWIVSLYESYSEIIEGLINE